jgi:hypothetical protein
MPSFTPSFHISVKSFMALEKGSFTKPCKSTIYRLSDNSK